MKLDPAAKYGFEGPAAGVGAIATWSGNDQIGEGRQTITESRSNELVRTKLDFKLPFEATATVEFTFRTEGAQTTVTWAMFGENNFLSRAVCLFMDQDKMIGVPFEEGLRSLNQVATSSAQR